MLAKKRAAGGHSSCRRCRPPGDRASWGLGRLGGRAARGTRGQLVELPLQLVQFLLKLAVLLVEIGQGTAFRLGPGGGKGPDLGYEAARLFLAEFPAPGWHPCPLAVE